jgi:O-antigen/teichoic acid export membrane protein
MSVRQLVQNFRTAVNPQIVKQYAAGNVKKSKKLLLSSTKYSYYLMLIIALPICILADPLLHIWLVEVPEYTVIFLQIVIVQSLFQVFDYSFYMALNAMGRLKENALISPLISFLIFPIVYILFKCGYSPIVLSWVSLIAYAILGLIVKPILIIKIAHYSLQDILSVFLSCLKVTVFSVPIPIFSMFVFNSQTLLGFILIGAISITSTLLSIYYKGLTEKNRKKLIAELKKRIVNT